MAGNGQGKRKHRGNPASSSDGGSRSTELASNQATSVQNDKKESVSIGSPASSKKERSGPTFEELAEILLEFPGMFTPLAELFCNASRDEGRVDIKDLADKIRRVAVSGEVYSQMELSGITLPTVLRDFGLLYDDDAFGTGAEHMWDIDEDASGLRKRSAVSRRTIASGRRLSASRGA